MLLCTSCKRFASSDELAGGYLQPGHWGMDTCDDCAAVDDSVEIASLYGTISVVNDLWLETSGATSEPAGPMAGSSRQTG